MVEIITPEDLDRKARLEVLMRQKYEQMERHAQDAMVYALGGFITADLSKRPDYRNEKTIDGNCREVGSIKAIESKGS